MSEAVNLKRARVVEFDYALPRDDHAIAPSERLIVNRGNRTDPFRVLANNDEPAQSGVWGTFREGDIDYTGTNITVLAEFPVTLADLIPDGCEAFRFKREYRVGLTATKGTGTEADIWVIGGMQGLWRDLNTLSADLGVDLDTVVPLVITVHSDYVEARR